MTGSLERRAPHPRRFHCSERVQQDKSSFFGMGSERDRKELDHIDGY